MNWKEELTNLKHAELERKYPAAYKASGGRNGYILKPFSDKTTNGLTKCIVDFLTLKGHYANRINTQGQARVSEIPRFNIFTGEMVSIGKNVQWTKSTTTKGTPDIDSIIFGKPAKIEVKVGRDTVKKEQKREGAKIERAGGYYFIARDMESFYEWYYEKFGEMEVKV